MLRTHPVFQVYIPDSLATQVDNLVGSSGSSCCKDIESIQLIGLWERIPFPSPTVPISKKTSERCDKQSSEGDSEAETTDDDNDEEIESGSVIVTFLGLIVNRHGIQCKDVTGLRDKVIGEVIFDKTQSGCFATRSIGLPSIWLTLRITDSSDVIVEQICLDNMLLFPDPQSVFLMQFNPRSLQYVYRLDLRSSGLPDIVVKGFAYTYKISDDLSLANQSNMNWFLPFLPKLEQEFAKIDPCGQFDDGYFQKYDNGVDVKSQILKRCMGMKQVLYKLHLMTKVITGKIGGLALGNLLVMMFVDIILGLVFTQYLLQFDNLYSTLHSKVEELLRILMQLLNWLQGSPAGLKLNAALNSLLWRFFSYHLHLWANYIGILEPILSFLLSVIISIGPLGLTVQISLIKDLLSMATFHVYCLYIYATRLFSVQLIAIKSLGRLFLGRKWNPLRNRVDHVNLSKSEMFLGALAFTIGVFLVPTTLIYYAVFLSLRLPVLIVESTLIYFIEIINCTQIVTNFLISINSSRISDEIFLEHVTPSPMLQTFRIKLQTTKKILIVPKVFDRMVFILQHIVQGKVLN